MSARQRRGHNRSLKHICAMPRETDGMRMSRQISPPCSAARVCEPETTSFDGRSILRRFGCCAPSGPCKARGKAFSQTADMLYSEVQRIVHARVHDGLG